MSEYSCNRQTRRSNPDNKFLNTPVFVNKTHKSKSHFNSSFEIAAPSLWNSLPLHVRTASSVVSFRSQLKSHLFAIAFPPWTPVFCAQCLRSYLTLAIVKGLWFMIITFWMARFEYAFVHRFSTIKDYRLDRLDLQFSALCFQCFTQSFTVYLIEVHWVLAIGEK